MCRLYGFRATEPTRLECALVRAQNALVVQSRRDRRGLSNADGWGVGFYERGEPVIEKCDAAASEGEHFRQIAERVCSSTILAHVRRATVGRASKANSHPFRVGTWTFAHNGTLTGFDALAQVLEAETEPALFKNRLGTTDSELVFLWLVGRLMRAGIAVDAACGDHELLAEVFGRSVGELAAKSEAAGATAPAKLNFLLTDGTTLAASRWGIGLHILVREGGSDCGICGSSHVEGSRADGYRACAVASEPITSETWEEIPEGSFAIITSDIATYTGRIG